MILPAMAGIANEWYNTRSLVRGRPVRSGIFLFMWSNHSIVLRVPFTSDRKYRKPANTCRPTGDPRPT